MKKKLYPYMNWPKIEAVIYSEDDNPHLILGKTICSSGTIFQTFQPQALRVFVLYAKESKKIEMEQMEQEGYFAAIVSERNISAYVYVVENEDGTIEKMQDPYNFDPVIKHNEIKKFEDGIHYYIYELLGAHEQIVEEQKGILFAVWAPNVMRVSVVGDFNNWDGRRHQMRRLYRTGVFELFIPELKNGDLYKFEIKLKNTLTYLKTDPYALETQSSPDTASVVSTTNRDFTWTDTDWIEFRKKTNLKEQRMNVLEINFSLFHKKQGYFSYREMAVELIAYAKRMRYTHIECMPIMECLEDASIDYKIFNYYAPTSRYGKPEDLKYFINLCHEENIGIIFDWVPGEFPKENQGLLGFDGTGLYEHENEKQGENYNNNTKKFNFGRREVSNFLIANALYWIEEYHADGLRLNKVGEMLYLDYGKKEGEWIPNIYGGNENLEAVTFIKELNTIVKKRNKGILTIAEDSTKWPNVTSPIKEDGLGFDFKWNQGWTYDMLGFFAKDPKYRQNVYNEFTFSTLYAYSEQFILCFTHQEMLRSKESFYDRMYGNKVEKYANLRAMYTYMFVHPGKKMMFLGQNPLTQKMWNAKESKYSNVMNDEFIHFICFMEDLHKLYEDEPALYQKDYELSGFQWINPVSPKECIYTFVRNGKELSEVLFVVCNFAKVPFNKKIVGVPFYGKYKEIFNTSMKAYGGNLEKLASNKLTEIKEADGMNFSIKVNLKPLSISIYKCDKKKYTK